MGYGGEERTSLGNSDKSLKTTTNIMNSLSGVGSNDVYTFMDKLADLGVRTRCDASMLRSDVQNRVRQLKSIVSSCPVYCRVAVNSRSGFVYGAREFNLESILPLLFPLRFIFSLSFNYFSFVIKKLYGKELTSMTQVS